jgi:hypothetical protein
MPAAEEYPTHKVSSKYFYYFGSLLYFLTDSLRLIIHYFPFARQPGKPGSSVMAEVRRPGQTRGVR